MPGHITKEILMFAVTYSRANLSRILYSRPALQNYRWLAQKVDIPF